MALKPSIILCPGKLGVSQFGAEFPWQAVQLKAIISRAGAPRWDLCSLFRQSLLCASSSCILRLNYSCFLSLLVALPSEMRVLAQGLQHPWGLARATGSATLPAIRPTSQPAHQPPPARRKTGNVFGFVHFAVSDVPGKTNLLFHLN